MHRKDTIASGHLNKPDLRQRSTKRVGCAYVYVLLSKIEQRTMTHNISSTTAPTSLRSITKHAWVESRSSAATPWVTLFSNLFGAPRLHDSHYGCIDVHIAASFVVVQELILALLLTFFCRGLRPFKFVVVYFARLLVQISMSYQFL